MKYVVITAIAMQLLVSCNLNHKDSMQKVQEWDKVFPLSESVSHRKEKFYKGSSKQRGSGIGLAVTDEIVRMHGGTLNIASTYGEGTQVTVTLPLANTDTKKAETKAIAADSGKQEE